MFWEVRKIGILPRGTDRSRQYPLHLPGGALHRLYHGRSPDRFPAQKELTQDEVHLYGSARLGLHKLARRMELWKTEDDPDSETFDYTFTTLDKPFPPTGPATTHTRRLSLKYYEISNHLGNILATVSDKKSVTLDFNQYNVAYLVGYAAEVLSVSDYYPFGSAMPGRSLNLGEYRFGFNGKESDGEIYGEGNSLDFGARVYDSRVGRWWSRDPLEGKFPSISPYVSFYNSPILMVDPSGNEGVIYLVFIQNDETKLQLSRDEMVQVQLDYQYICDLNCLNLDIKIIQTSETEKIPLNLFDYSDAIIYHSDAATLTKMGFEGFSDEDQYGISPGVYASTRQGAVATDRIKSNNFPAARMTYDDSELDAELDEIKRTKKMTHDPYIWDARIGVHEGLGHGWLGNGHTDQKPGPIPDLEYDGSIENEDILKQANNTFFHPFPQEMNQENFLLFKPGHLKKINERLDGITPTDNYSKRVKVMNQITPISPTQKTYPEATDNPN